MAAGRQPRACWPFWLSSSATTPKSRGGDGQTSSVSLSHVTLVVSPSHRHRLRKEFWKAAPVTVTSTPPSMVPLAGLIDQTRGGL